MFRTPVGVHTLESLQSPKKTRVRLGLGLRMCPGRSNRPSTVVKNVGDTCRIRVEKENLKTQTNNKPG